MASKTINTKNKAYKATPKKHKPDHLGDEATIKIYLDRFENLSI